METEREEERVEKRVDRKGALTEKSKEVAFEAQFVGFTFDKIMKRRERSGGGC